MAQTIDNPRHPWAAALWPVVRFGLWTFLISLALSLLVTPWLDLSWWQVFRRCVSIGAGLSLWLCITKFEKRSVSSYGLISPRAGRRHLLFGAALGLGTISLMLGMFVVSGACKFDVIPDRARLWWTIVTFIPLAGLISVLEELVFRGYILQHLLRWSRPVAITASSALYALVHLKVTTVTMTTGLELIGLFLLGVVLVLAYLLTNHLYLAMGLHASLAYGARINKLILSFPNPSLAWLVGNSRLVNGILSWIGLAVIGAVVVWWARGVQRGGASHG